MGERGYIRGLGRLSAGGSIWEWQWLVLGPGPFPATLPRIAQPHPGFSAACSQQSHVGEALPPEMVTRLYDGMRRVDLTGKAMRPSDSVSQEQFTVSMSHLLKGNSEEKSLVILKMISATECPVKAREVQKVERPRGHLQPCQAASGVLRWGLSTIAQLVEAHGDVPLRDPRPHHW